MAVPSSSFIGDPLTARSRGSFAAKRLLPGDDLIAGLRRIQREAAASAMAIVTCVGSLRAVQIRHADADDGTLYEGRFEIVSLTGTVNPDHQHLHISVGDQDGRVFGGHLLSGSDVYTTAEIVALILPELSFGRAHCEGSGFNELTITQAKAET